MIRAVAPWSILAIALLFAAGGDDKKFSIKTTTHTVPTELSESIRKLLAGSSVQLLDAGGAAICEVWLRKQLPAEATPEQLKTGVTYKEIKQTELFGAIQFHKDWTDYRKQKIKAGVYTMRLAYQPTDGKHTPDISEFQDFVLVTAAKADPRPDLIEPKALHETSGDSIGSGHPGVFMLWPNAKPGAEPALAARPKDHWVLNVKTELVVDGKAAGVPFGIGINLVGHSPAE